MELTTAEALLAQAQMPAAPVLEGTGPEAVAQAPAGAAPPPDPFAVAQAALSEQWELLSQQLQMLGSGSESEIFSGLVRQTLDMLNQSSQNFSSLLPQLQQVPAAFPAPQAEPVRLETLAATMDALFDKNVAYVNKTISAVSEGMDLARFKPAAQATPE